MDNTSNYDYLTLGWQNYNSNCVTKKFCYLVMNKYTFDNYILAEQNSRSYLKVNTYKAYLYTL